MVNFTRMILAFLFFLSSVVAFAKSEIPTRKIKKGFEITVNSYDKATDTFLLTVNVEPDVGPNYVTPEDLRKAIDYEGGKTDFNKQREQMLGSVYSLKKDLRLLELTDLAARKRKL